jgi:4-hydroxybenzoate polyprenyltransferase
MRSMLSRRLFPILQLARMALVFTAISNAWCTLFLFHALRGEGVDLHRALLWKQMLAVALISTGLYGFGMTLTDIIDRRRDQQLAAHRPLPSGRVGVGTAHLIAAILLLMAIVAAVIFQRWSNDGWMSIVLVIWTAVMIVFYDVAGKYLVALGLLTLGLIRFFHALIPAPQLPLLWHPLLLLNHVTVLSLVSYWWEEKRPALTPLHWAMVPGGLMLIDALLIGLLAWRRGAEALLLRRSLALPAGAVLAFVMLAWIIRDRSATPREAGGRLMLYGLLWLIAYDACFAAAYVSLGAALVLLALLPTAYLSVQVMRWWGGLMALSQRPAFKRAE